MNGAGQTLNPPAGERLGAVSFLRKILARTAGDSEKGRFTASLSLPALIGVGAIFVSVVGWAFFMGLMVGGGQNPASKISDLTGGLLNPDSPAAERPAPEIVAEAGPAPGSDEHPAPATPQKEKPEGAALEAWPSAKETPAARPKKPAPQPRPTAKAGDRAVYDYVFQTAAARTQRDADNLAKKLKALGLRSSVQKSGKVYLAIVNLRGGDADVNAMREKLRSLKLGKPLLLSKKERPAKQGKSK